MAGFTTAVFPLVNVLILIKCCFATSIPDWDARLSTPYEGFCENDADCMYLGVCQSNACTCDAGFKGKHCHELDLLPTQEDWGYLDPVRPSWGGTVVRHDGKYILYASYMVNRCDIVSYGINSAILRAEAAKPYGPYRFRTTLLKPFHHGAVAIPGKKGSIYIYHDGAADIPARLIHNCVSRKEPNGMPQRAELTSSAKRGVFRYGESPHDFIGVSHLDGPLANVSTRRVITQSNLRGGIACNRTNPSPLLLGDGTVLLALRTTFCSLAGRPACNYKTNCQHIYLVRQRDPMAPISDNSSQWQHVKQLEASEDPFLWRDARGRFHMLVHSKRACGIHDTSGCSLIASSPDSVDWNAASRPALRGYVTWRNSGQREKGALMQRPKIFFDEDGTTPLFLICGFRRRPGSQVFTLFIPFNVSANANLRVENKISSQENEVAEEAESKGEVSEDTENKNPDVPDSEEANVAQGNNAGVLPVDVELESDPRWNETIHDKPLVVLPVLAGFGLSSMQGLVVIPFVGLCICTFIKRRLRRMTSASSQGVQYSAVRQEAQ